MQHYNQLQYNKKWVPQKVVRIQVSMSKLTGKLNLLGYPMKQEIRSLLTADHSDAKKVNFNF